jgi:hypothetical protein
MICVLAICASTSITTNTVDKIDGMKGARQEEHSENRELIGKDHILDLYILSFRITF